MIDSPGGGETTRSALRRLVDTLRVTVKEIKGKGKRRVGVTGEEPGRCESTIAKEGKTKSQQGGTSCQNMPVSGTKSERILSLELQFPINLDANVKHPPFFFPQPAQPEVFCESGGKHLSEEAKSLGDCGDARQ